MHSEKRRPTGEPYRVLVVCTGNSCRSPMAAGMLDVMLSGEPVEVSSAGTMAPVGGPATAAAREAALEYGADLSGHRARQLVPVMVRQADLVLVMEEYHRDAVVGLDPAAAAKTKLLLEYAGRPGEEVPDPVGMPLEQYRRTAQMMRPALENVAREVRDRLRGTAARS